MKLANMDHIFSLIPREDGIGEDFFTFVDLCGGPGGFSEYILLRCKQQNQKCRGFGISLKVEEVLLASSCNWNIDYLHTPPDISIVHQNMQRTYESESYDTSR